MKLKISNDITFPLEACTQTFAILAKRRAGKTYTALVMAEEFIGAHIPFVALDPLGAWWGLRSSQDGKSEGFPVVIIGGSHGDVPLEPTAGKVIADLVVDHPGHYVVDMSLTQSNAEQDRFACDFAERLYRRKEQKREPLHLFVDEADSFAPQRPLDGQLRMLGAYEALIRRGGIRGIGVTSITQRPAVLNKNVLSQTECLIVLQMTAPQDKSAIDDWIKDNGTKEQRDQFISSLAELQMGEAWIWSPSWLDVFKRVKIRQRHTFDSSATPKYGEKVTAKTLATVDLDWLGKEIQATVERVKENDPGHLKKEISLLRTELIKERERYSGLEKSQARKPLFEEKDKQLLGEIRHHVDELKTECESLILELQCAGEKCTEYLTALKALTSRLPTITPDKVTASPSFKATTAYRDTSGSRQTWNEMNVAEKPDRAIQAQTFSDGDWKPGKCERQILRALAQYPQGRSQNQIAVITGYAQSGGFRNALAALRSRDLITRGLPIQITEAGLQLVGGADPLPTGDGLKSIWFQKLAKAEREILNCLFQAYPNGMMQGELAQQTNYAESGGFRNALSKLRTLELITRGQPIKASENFFQ